MGPAAAAMIYQSMGYQGQPTEIDIISDLVKNQAPVARFLVSEQGFPALATFLGVFLDYKLVQFFKNYRIGVVQDESSGQMYLQPMPEQPTEQGKELHTMTIAEVQSSIASISDMLRSNLIARADEVVSKHKQAANALAQGSMVEGMMAEAVSSNKGAIAGAASGALNLGLRALGVPVPAASASPPPPPGR